MEFSLALIISYSLIIATYCLSFFYFYSYYIYQKNTIFTKTKYSFLNIFFSSFVIFMFLIALIFSIIISLNKNNKYHNQQLGNIIFLSIILFFGIFHLSYSLLIPKIVNKNKLDFKNFREINFIKIKKELEDKLNKNRLNKTKNKNKNHFLKIENDKNYIMEMLKQNKEYSDILSSIICFSEEHTNKWSNNINNYLQIIICEFSINLQEKIN